MRLGSLEAGGTKMVMGVLDGDGQILKQASCATRLPEETMADVLAFFKGDRLDAMGIASFGPVDLQKQSPTYGHITHTPKLSWRGFPLLQTIRDALGVPCGMDTDVNGAVLAEATMGAAKGQKNAVYFTVGTGIGGGLLSEARLVHGLIHPEWGHTVVARHPEDPLTRGTCPSHTNCVEGYATGPAMQKRWAVPAQELPDDHRGWALEAWYLAQLCQNAMMAVSPERIMLGGGVMRHEALFPLVRAAVKELVGGYLISPVIDDLDTYIVPPALAPNSGLIGGALLAKAALEEA